MFRFWCCVAVFSLTQVATGQVGAEQETIFVEIDYCEITAMTGRISYEAESRHIANETAVYLGKQYPLWKFVAVGASPNDEWPRLRLHIRSKGEVPKGSVDMKVILHPDENREWKAGDTVQIYAPNHFRTTWELAGAKFARRFTADMQGALLGLEDNGLKKRMTRIRVASGVVRDVEDGMAALPLPWSTCSRFATSTFEILCKKRGVRGRVVIVSFGIGDHDDVGMILVVHKTYQDLPRLEAKQVDDAFRAQLREGSLEYRDVRVTEIVEEDIRPEDSRLRIVTGESR